MDTVKIFGRCAGCSIPNRMCRVLTTYGQYGGRERWITYEFCFQKSRKRALLYDLRASVVKVKPASRPGAYADVKSLEEICQAWSKATH